MREKFAIDLKPPDIELERPDFAEPFRGMLENAVITRRPLRIVALDIKDVTPLDHGGSIEASVLIIVGTGEARARREFAFLRPLDVVSGSLGRFEAAKA